MRNWSDDPLLLRQFLWVGTEVKDAHKQTIDHAKSLFVFISLSLFSMTAFF